MDKDKEKKYIKKFKLKFHRPRYNLDKVEYFMRYYDSDIGFIRIYYHRGWKYHLVIEHPDGEYGHKHFSKKSKLIEYLIKVNAEYIEKYWTG